MSDLLLPGRAPARHQIVLALAHLDRLTRYLSALADALDHLAVRLRTCATSLPWTSTAGQCCQVAITQAATRLGLGGARSRTAAALAFAHARALRHQLALTQAPR